MMTLTKSPPEEDTATLAALDFEAAVPCECRHGAPLPCPNEADVMLDAPCSTCGTVQHVAYCSECVQWLLRSVASEAVIVCPVGHDVTAGLRFRPIK